ncbi:DUF4189 domain-containing protein [Streptomyces sp. NPDC088560]|uniref:DUF4189 domain-containing protein n=1 Tax=Streptomyces sp. NPDC088560 TaxID=3365868 RepID=UPI0038136410
MTSPPAPQVEHGTLALGRQLGQGGQGAVHQVLNKKINRADSGGWDVVYKEYNSTVLPQLEATALELAVELLVEPGFGEGQWLCEKTAWPAAVVRRQGQACGFLMRAVPDRFQFTLRSLAGSGTGNQRLANLEYLLNDDAYVAGIGLTISDRDRLALLADLAATLTRLHRIGITVGDLSPKNLLFATAPRPECFLIDCDAMMLRGRTVLPQAETPDWQLPAGEPKATPPGDIYKFTLLAIRLFAREQTADDPAALTGISPALAALARAGLSPAPASRPTPSQWAEQLATATRKASGVPGSGRTGTNRPGGRQPRTANRSGPQPPTRGGTRSTPRTTPGNSSPGKAIATIAALAGVVILGIALQHSGDSSGSDTTPQSNVSALENTPADGSDPAHPYDDPTTQDATVPDDGPDPTYDPPDPAPTYDPPDPVPTYDPPTLAPTTPPSPPPPPPPPAPPPPPPSYFGAIAVGNHGGIGKAWDYKSEGAAQQGALTRCPDSGCKVLTTFVNGCGAIAYNTDSGQYWGGHGATEYAAENDAIANAGGGRWITAVCTTRY